MDSLETITTQEPTEHVDTTQDKPSFSFKHATINLAKYGAIHLPILGSMYAAKELADFYKVESPVWYSMFIIGAGVAGAIGLAIACEEKNRVVDWFKNRYSNPENSPLLDAAIVGGGVIAAVQLADLMYKG